MTKHMLAKLLRPFKIGPRMLRSKLSKGTSSGARGYLQEHFVTVWNDLLNNAAKTCEQQQTNVAQQPGLSAVNVSANNIETVKPSAVSSQPNATVTTKQEIAGAASSGSPTRADVARDGVTVRAGVARDGVTQIPNKDAACCNVAETRIDPRMLGILADPRNYFGQYPERHKQGTRDIIVNKHHWPQPADDKGPADVIYTLDDGISIPYTRVNRDPWAPQSTPSYRNKRDRWPVLLSDDEKTQVATARFFELHAAARAQRENNRTA
jgi:hypothetical protein